MLDNERTRGRVRGIVEPLAKALLKAGVSPNQVTVGTAIACWVLAVITWSRGEFGLGLLVGLPFIVGDLLDGTMARLSGQVTKFGSFLDSLLDRVTDFAVLGSVAYWYATQYDLHSVAAALWALMVGAAIPYARAKAESLGVPCKVGLMERSERLAVLALAALLALLGVQEAMVYALYVLAVLGTFTVIQRIRAVQQGLANATE